MNLIQRLGPYAYATLHSYNSLWEILLGPAVRRRARQDSERLAQRFPALSDYERQAAPVRQRLSSAYQDYTSNVSPSSIAVSLELAVFVTVLCELSHPKAILDLGSGFSSFAFRGHAKRTPEPRPEVYSIDESPAWLDQTRGFLRQHGLPDHHLLTWDQFAATASKPAFDVILHDIGQLSTRRRLLDAVIDACRPGGFIVIDDMHVPGYRRAILEKLDRRQLAYFSLRTFTKKRMRYSYLVMR